MNNNALERSHLSVSQLKSYLQCPRKYFYQYIEAATPAFRSIALTFGSAWHTAIGSYLINNITPEDAIAFFRDLLVSEVESSEIPVLFDDEEDLGTCVDMGAKTISAFIEKVPRPEAVLGIEVPFVLDITRTQNREDYQAPIIGSIDALVIEQNTTVIWELKTSKRKWSRDQLDYDFQPTAYRMGARRLDIPHATLKLLIATKTKTPDVQIETVVRTLEDEARLARLVSSVLRAIRAGVDHPIQNWACRGCCFSTICT